MAFILILLNAGTACAQSPANSIGVECVERLDIPKYPAFADSARVTATITTTVRLAADGTVDRINSDISSAKGKEVQNVFIKTIDVITPCHRVSNLRSAVTKARSHSSSRAAPHTEYHYSRRLWSETAISDFDGAGTVSTW
jgi:hypothetical protein